MCFVSFYSVPNLTVIMFNLLYPAFYVGFICKSCVWERGRGSVWKLKALKTEVFSRVARDLASREVMHMPCTWLECEESGQMETAVSREYFAGKPSRETPAKYSVLPNCAIWYTLSIPTLYTHITHKSWGVLQKENPSHKPWELEIVILTYLYTFACGFPQLLSLHFHIIERLIDSPNTYHTLSEC